ncbi:hemolysin family protein [Corynebacterium tapiri]|uniref:HlyC/CorC family transporter n=1 Tax=Corynebacterium tapiri TaxID=1448266 RepID=A0A5C4U2I6_9CORY|nr:hemolysin family protein [Corynebacterium tapiri]TNL96596.1 HlyC/CorC family transporter [Corynebacterium tapiri]
MLSAIGLLLLGFLIIALIIAWNGYHVAQEFAYMSVDRQQLRSRANSGDAQAQAALKVTERTSFMLSGAQLGITVSGLLAGFVAQPLVGEALGSIFGTFGVPVALSVTVGTIAALIVTTIVQMIFGELLPKNYTIAAPMKSSLALARSTRIYLALFGWLIKFFDWSSNALLRLLHIEPVEDVDSTASRDDLERVLDESRESGELDDRTFMVLDRMLEFPEQDVDHAMIPRSRVEVLTPEDTVETAKREMHQSHTRYPVIDEEHVPVGIVHVLDVLDPELDQNAPISTIMREPVIVHELMALPDAVAAIRETGDKVACVIDEYGGFVGIVSMEDLGEEVLGEISDEHEETDTEEITATSAIEWVADGDTPIDEVERTVGYDLPDGDYETLSGLLLSEAGGLIEEGEQVVLNLQALPEDYVEEGYVPHRALYAEVLEVERNVPSEIKLTLVDPEADNAEVISHGHRGSTSYSSIIDARQSAKED